MAPRGQVLRFNTGPVEAPTATVCDQLRRPGYHLQSRRCAQLSFQLVPILDDSAQLSPPGDSSGYSMTRARWSTVMDRRKSEARDS